MPFGGRGEHRLLGWIWSHVPARLALLVLLSLPCITIVATSSLPDMTSWAVLEAQIPDVPVQPLASLTSPPRVVEVAYVSTGDGTIAADLYVPVGAGRFPGILLVNGVEPDGRRLPEFAHLANSLCRAGFVVLAPDIPGLVHERVRPEDVGAVVASFDALAESSSVDPTHIGMIGFSIGASLELLAAEDPTIAKKVRLVDDIGGYARLDDVLQAATTHTVTGNDGRTRDYVPNPYVWEVGRNSLIGLLPVAQDRDALARLFPGAQPIPSAKSAGLVDHLSPGGRALYDLFVNRDAGRLPALIDNLPMEVRSGMTALSPDANLAAISANVHIVHDRGDPFIPVEESYRLASSPALKGHASLLELDVLQHVELSAPDLTPPQLFGVYLPQMAALNGYVRDTFLMLED